MTNEKKTIMLGTGGPMNVNSKWHHCIYPAKNFGCCVLEFLHKTPTNAKELEEFFDCLDELTFLFRAGCLRQLLAGIRKDRAGKDELKKVLISKEREGEIKNQGFSPGAYGQWAKEVERLFKFVFGKA